MNRGGPKNDLEFDFRRTNVHPRPKERIRLVTQSDVGMGRDGI